MNSSQHTVLTPRDLSLMKLLAQARWLNTSQIRITLFPEKTPSAVNKRMAKLVAARWLRTVRPDWMAERYYSLTERGRQHVGQAHAGNLGCTQTTRFPKQLKHFSWINDLRLWFQRQGLGRVSYQAFWENHPGGGSSLIPDAIAIINQELRLAIEVDCGTENANTVAQKIARYERDPQILDSPLEAVLVWAPGWRRVHSIAAACYRVGVGMATPACWLADINTLKTVGLESRDFVDLRVLDDESQSAVHSLRALLGSPVGLSCRSDRLTSVSDSPQAVSSDEDGPYADAIAGRPRL